jgi:hypothetical protein
VCLRFYHHHHHNHNHHHHRHHHHNTEFGEQQFPTSFRMVGCTASYATYAMYNAT